MNKAILIGNIGQDPELRFTQKNTPVMRIRMATTDRRKEGDEWVDFTEWHDVIVFGKRASGLQKVLSKGSRIAVEGRLSTNSWDDKQGVKRYRTEIIADDVELLGGGKQTRDRRSGPDDDGSDEGYSSNSKSGFGDDDIPF